MAVVAADIKAFAPEFAATADAIITLWLGWAYGAAGLSSTVFGSALDQAVLFWVCHNLKKGQNSGSSGTITEEHVGPAGQSFSGPGAFANPSEFRTTSYGLLYYQLCRQFTAGGLSL